MRGGGVIVLPLVHKVGKLKLTARQINVNLADAVTRQGIKVAVQGVATFKIGADDESIRNAAERFLESQEEAVDSIVKNVLEGSLRSIVGTLTVEELNLDRQKFQQAVQDAAKGDLATSGLQIDSFTIQAIRDESGYMELIGQQETARRERDARMAKASADQEAAVRKPKPSRSRSMRHGTSRFAAPRPRPRPRPPTPVPRRPVRSPRPRRPRRSPASRPSSPSSRRQGRNRSCSLPPSARPRQTPQPRSAAPRATSGAHRGGPGRRGTGPARRRGAGRVVEVTAEAMAKQTTLEGNAEAGIVLSKGEAEAKALALRADAYRQFNEAAIIQTVLSQLPDIVRAAAEPMGNIEHLTVLSNDGASDIVKNVTRTVTEASTTVKGLTGIDIPGLLSQAMGDATRAATAEPTAGSAPVGARDRPPRRGGPAPSGGTPPAAHGRAAGECDRAGGRPSPTPPPARPRRLRERTPPAPPRPTPRHPGSRLETSRCRHRADADRAVRAASAPLGPRTDTAADPPDRPLSPRAPPHHRQTTLDAAAPHLAADLRAIPGIDRFAAVRLTELDRSGSASAPDDVADRPRTPR